MFVHVADAASDLELGPLADAVAAWPIEAMDLVLSESDERAFNWKALLENYSENYHTPFVHPEIDTTSTEDYPMVSDGPVLYAWDRLRDHDGSDDQRIRSELLPGEPGWERIFAADTERPYDVGSYLTIWPNADGQPVPGCGARDVDAIHSRRTGRSSNDGSTQLPGRTDEQLAGDRRGPPARPRPGRRHLSWPCSGRTTPASMPTACSPRSRNAACSSSTNTSVPRSG